MKELTQREKSIVVNALIDVIADLNRLSSRITTEERRSAIMAEINDIQSIIEKINK